jgi:hypothetical protein
VKFYLFFKLPVLAKTASCPFPKKPYNLYPCPFQILAETLEALLLCLKYSVAILDFPYVNLTANGPDMPDHHSAKKVLILTMKLWKMVEKKNTTSAILGRTLGVGVNLLLEDPKMHFMSIFTSRLKGDIPQLVQAISPQGLLQRVRYAYP